MSDGFGCKCMARSASECCCEHVDWRSSREVELEIENDDLRKARKIYLDSIEQLRAENAALKAELAEAKVDASNDCATCTYASLKEREIPCSKCVQEIKVYTNWKAAKGK